MTAPIKLSEVEARAKAATKTLRARDLIAAREDVPALCAAVRVLHAAADRVVKARGLAGDEVHAAIEGLDTALREAGKIVEVDGAEAR